MTPEELLLRAEAAEAETQNIKAKAEVYITEAKARIAASKLEAQALGHERDEWWQKVFLVALQVPGLLPEHRVGFAAGAATDAVRARAGLLKEGTMPLEASEVPMANYIREACKDSL